MNHLEVGLQTAAAVADAAIAKPGTPVTNNGLVYNGSAWVAAALVDANISASAAIAYSKLNLAGLVVNNDIAAAAAIAASKLADPGSGNVITSAGAGAIAAKPPGYEYDYAQITADVSVTATAFATPTTLITGASVAYDGATAVWIEVFCPHATMPLNSDALFLTLWDGSTDLGIIAKLNGAASGVLEDSLYGKRKFTPSNASHTFSVRGVMNAATPGTFGAGAGGTGGTFLPAYLRISRA